jgi:IclR family transcriptional regulator, pca regulon regulatory protein
MGIGEVGDRLGLSRATVHRYAATLLALGYVEQDARRKYRLGTAPHDLGAAVLASTCLPRVAAPLLGALRERTCLSASCVVLDGDEIVVVQHARSHRAGQRSAGPRVAPGARRPAYETACGHALLACLPEETRSEVLPRLEPKLRRTLTPELPRIREEGFASYQHPDGLFATATPVLDNDDRAICAIGLASPEADAEQALAHHRQALLATGRELGLLLRRCQSALSVSWRAT